MCYMKRTKGLRGDRRLLFLSYKKGFKKELRIKEHMVEVSVAKHHAARHVVQGDPELGFFFGQLLLGPFAPGP